jgi:hypothetical protein
MIDRMKGVGRAPTTLILLSWWNVPQKVAIAILCALWYWDMPTLHISNGNASETKANESFDNGVFFDIEAKQTPSIVSKLFSKLSEHIR